MIRSIRRRQLKAIAALPGVVTALVPALLVWLRPTDRDLTLALRLPLAIAGAGLLLAGLWAMARAIGLFSTVGEGTLAPWDPTRQLVVRGIYRHVRNPMISGVTAVLFGEAALFGSPALLAWALGFAAVNLAWIPLVEEPGLVRRFGEPYLEYRRNVPRWIPRWRGWSPPGES